MKKEDFPVVGMMCAGCASTVQRCIAALPGVQHSAVNLATEQVAVEYDESLLTPAEMSQALHKVGYEMLIEEKQEALTIQEERMKLLYRKMKRQVIVSWAGAVLLMLVMYLCTAPHQQQASHWAQMFLALITLIYGGRDFYLGAIKRLRTGSTNMDTLVALSTSVAFLYSLYHTLFPMAGSMVYYEASAMIIAFVLTGRFLEHRAKGATTSSIRKLMGLQPETASLIVDGKEKEVKIGFLRAGLYVAVHPGERIPVDGEITEGDSYVDESMITGEPMAVHKKKGDTVLTGTINQKGYFRMCVTKAGSETFLARIIRRVQDAQGGKAPVERIVDRIVSWFVPVILAISLLTFAGWILLAGTGQIDLAVQAAVSVLVIACPCALGLATPTALMVGIGKGAAHQILVKDAVALELMRKVDTVVLDKTGTLTEGKPEMQEWVECPPFPTEIHILNGLVGLEQRSEHPLASAFVDFMTRDGEIVAGEVDAFTIHPGEGVSALFEGEDIWAGNEALMHRKGASATDEIQQMVVRYQANGDSVIYCGWRDRLSFLAIFRDELKSSSYKAVKDLQQSGKQVIMLTGDAEKTAQIVADKLGISTYCAGMLPDDKEQYIQQLQAQGRTVAMVGDGINDSQALARADVSVAMGRGTDVAMDVAQVTLITNDLRLLQKAFRLSEQTVSLIHRNLFWAFIYNVIAIPLAMGVFYPVWGILLNPMVASAAMAFSSVSVVVSSLLLNRRGL